MALQSLSFHTPHKVSRRNSFSSSIFFFSTHFDLYLPLFFFLDVFPDPFLNSWHTPLFFLCEHSGRVFPFVDDGIFVSPPGPTPPPPPLPLFLGVSSFSLFFLFLFLFFFFLCSLFVESARLALIEGYSLTAIIFLRVRV